jgi:hypothetical protein
VIYVIARRTLFPTKQSPHINGLLRAKGKSALATSVTLILDEGFALTGDLHPVFMLPKDDTVSRTSWDKIYQYKIARTFPGHGV